jgi:hypothetical protein
MQVLLLLALAACAAAAPRLAADVRTVNNNEQQQLCGLSYQQIQQLPCGYPDDGWVLLAQQYIFATWHAPPCTDELLVETRLYLEANCEAGSLACKNETTQELFDALVECSGENLSYCECDQACAEQPVVTVVTTTIQDAIDRSCPYGVVLVPPGNYPEPRITAFKNRRGQKLHGLRIQGLPGAHIVAQQAIGLFVGDPTDILLGQSPRPGCPPAQPCPADPPLPGRSELGPADVVVRGLEVSNASFTGVMAYGSPRYVFDQLHVHDCGAYGTFPICSEWGYTTSNVIENSGVAIYNGDCIGGYIYDNLVRYCKVGIEIEATSYNDAARNTFQDCFEGGGIFALPWLPFSEASHNIVRNNTFVRIFANAFATNGNDPDVTGFGLFVFGGNNNTVANNVFVQAGVIGVSVIDVPAIYYATNCSGTTLNGPYNSAQDAVPDGILPFGAECLDFYAVPPQRCRGDLRLLDHLFAQSTRVIGNQFYDCGNNLGDFAFFPGMTHGWDVSVASNVPTGSQTTCVDEANTSDQNGDGSLRSIYTGCIPAIGFYPLYSFLTSLGFGTTPWIDNTGTLTAQTGIVKQEPMGAPVLQAACPL